MDIPKRSLVGVTQENCETCDEQCRIVFRNGRASITCLKLLKLLDAAGKVDIPTITINSEKIQILGLCG